MFFDDGGVIPMTAYKYNFETNWRFEADITQIWDLINQFNYGEWWKGLNATRIKKGEGKAGVGDRFISIFKTKLPYELSFESEIVKIESPSYLEIQVSGELEGRGIWKISQEGPITHVQYIWQVNTNKKWMNTLEPLLRPAFIWNHNQVMNEGAKGISNSLGVRLISL
jgi:hypothetical protein